MAGRWSAKKSERFLGRFVIPESAHHLDLFFSDPNDTEDLVNARRREVNEIRRWVEEKKFSAQVHGNFDGGRDQVEADIE